MVWIPLRSVRTLGRRSLSTIRNTKGSTLPGPAPAIGHQAVFVRSVNVFPILALGPIRECEQQSQETQHEHPDVDARVSRRLVHVIDIVDEIGDESLVLDACQLA